MFFGFLICLWQLLFSWNLYYSFSSNEVIWLTLSDSKKHEDSRAQTKPGFWQRVVAVRVLQPAWAPAGDSWLSTDWTYLGLAVKMCRSSTPPQVGIVTHGSDVEAELVWARLHVAASLSHESERWTKPSPGNSSHVTCRLSCYPPPLSFPIAVVLVSPVSFPVPFRLFSLYLLLFSSLLSSSFGTNGFITWWDETVQPFVLGLTVLSVLYLAINQFASLCPFPVPVLVVQWGPVSWLMTITCQHAQRQRQKHAHHKTFHTNQLQY